MTELFETAVASERSFEQHLVVASDVPWSPEMELIYRAQHPRQYPSQSGQLEQDARQALTSQDPPRRVLGIRVLAHALAPADLVETLLPFASDEDDNVKREVAWAFYTTPHVDAVPTLLRLSHSEDSDLRRGCAAALGKCAEPDDLMTSDDDTWDESFTSEVTPEDDNSDEDQSAIDRLIELTSDNDGKVRAMATMSLADCESTDDSVIAALKQRASDADAFTQQEALVGLICRRDDTAYDLMRVKAEEHSLERWMIQAMADSGDLRYRELLTRARLDNDDLTEEIDLALLALGED